ncbi:response regulator [Maribacter sp. 2308TA10-17]|uniref:response regulator n=1 Tax=Maribacter sp. 2308TA10-17 TaxID=3386276 RepID=UPI0039BD2893
MSSKIGAVYIVDDDPIIVYSMNRLMMEMNFYESLNTFENGKKAIEALQMAHESDENLPDILFLDLTMPEMNGFEFLNELSKMDSKTNGFQQIRVIVISSSVNPREIEKINSYPMVEKYIVKPLTPSDLKQLIEI